MTKILLGRHCESKRHPTLDYTIDELTRHGEQQAQKMANYIDSNIEHIISSPQKRSRNTAKIVSEIMEIPYSVNEDWAELNRGVYTKRPYEEFLREWSKYNKSFDYVPPKGESVNHGRKRAFNGLKRMVDSERNTLCITHAGLISNILMMFYSFEFEEGKPAHGGICELRYEQGELILDPTENNFFLNQKRRLSYSI